LGLSQISPGCPLNKKFVNFLLLHYKNFLTFLTTHDRLFVNFLLLHYKLFLTCLVLLTDFFC
jgi:hypothetical protein